MAFYSNKIVSNEFIGPTTGTASFASNASAAFTASVVRNQAYVKGKYGSPGIIPENSNNTASVADSVVLVGTDNKTAVAANLPVFLVLAGNGNIISGSGWGTAVGQGNVFRGTTYPTTFGYINYISGSLFDQHNTAIGFDNYLLGTSYAYTFGRKNIITNASHSMAIGRNLVITSSTSDAYVIGSNISASHNNTLHVNNLWVSGSIIGGNLSTGGATVTISGSIPSGSRASGSLWWNNNDGNLYIQVVTPTGSTYVPATNTVAGGNYGATLTTARTGSTWEINHNLNTRTPLITVYSGSSVMIPSTIDSLDANNTRITFANSVTGTVVLSTGIGNATANLAQTASFATSASFAASASFATTADNRNVEFYSGMLASNQSGVFVNIDVALTTIESRGLVTSGNTVTLKAGVTYMIQGTFRSFGFSNTTGGFLGLRLVNASTNVKIPGTTDSNMNPFTAASPHVTNQPVIMGIFTPTADTVVKVRGGFSNGECSLDALACNLTIVSISK